MKIEKTANCPKSLFKFYSNSQYNLEAFLHSYIYMSHPYQFNDLMDTRYYTLDVRNIDKRTFDILKQNEINDTPEIQEYCNFNWNGDYIFENLQKIQEYIFDSFFSFCGVSSFAEQNRFNELMWSHYAKESGFMIEFDFEKLIEGIESDRHNGIFKRLLIQPMQYKMEFASIKSDAYSSFQKMNEINTYQKGREWEYENEWRITACSDYFLGKYDYYKGLPKKWQEKRRLYYQTDAIKRIYIGKKFWTSDNKFLKDEKYKSDNSCRKYILNPSEFEIDSRFVQFVRLLRELLQKKNNILFMSGALEYGKVTLGEDEVIHNAFTGDYEPKCYNLSRAFEQIKDILIDENDSSIIVEYSNYEIRGNEYFDTLD